MSRCKTQMKRFLIPMILFLSSCSSNTVAEFDAIGHNEELFSIILKEDSSYIQEDFVDGVLHRDYGSWKGSFKLDSTLTTYIVLENGSILGSNTYKNINDTL